MHGRGKSDFAIVAVKPTNKAERSAAEPVEPRAGTKGNAGQQSTCRAQSRKSVSHRRPYPLENEPVQRIPRAFRTQTRLCRHSNRSPFARGKSAGKGFGVARDRDGIFGDTDRFRVTETALFHVSGGKAAESQRLF